MTWYYRWVLMAPSMNTTYKAYIVARTIQYTENVNVDDIRRILCAGLADCRPPVNRKQIFPDN